MVRDPAADVDARRSAATALEGLALVENYGAEARSPEQVRALRDDLSALAAVVGRAGDDLRVRMTLVRVLAAEPLKPLAAETVPALLGLMGDESDDPALRCATLAALAPVGPVEPCREAVLAAARGHTDEVRATALYTLERMAIDPDLCLTVAESALDDPSEPVRLAALDLIGDLADKRRSRAVTALLRAFQHRERSLRLLALVRLRGFGRDAAPVVGDLSTALEDPDPRIRIKVATALVEITGDGAPYVPYLVDGLRSKDIHVWRSSASDLMFGWRPRAGSVDARVPALSAALDDPDPDARGRVAVVLAHITRRPGPYARSIERALESSDPATRGWAALWGKAVLRDTYRVAPPSATSPSGPTRPGPGRRPSPIAVAVGLLTGLVLAVFAWFDARSRR